MRNLRFAVGDLRLMRTTKQLLATATAMLVLMGLARAAVQPFVYENPFELQSDGDFDGDGRRDLVIVDAATGSYRIAYQLSLDTYTWASARASGIAPATGLGIGKLNSLTYDSLAFSGASANRVNILDANNTAAAGLPQSFFGPSVGPNAVGVIDIGGGGNTPHADLYVPTIYNGASAYRQTLVRNDGTTNRTVISDLAGSFLRERINAILVHTNRAPLLGLFQRSVSATADIFNFLNLSSGGVVQSNLVATPNNSPKPWEYVTGQFVVTNPYTQVLFYGPGNNFIYQYQVNEPAAGTYGFAFTTSYVLSNWYDRIFALPGTNGTKLLVLWTNGISATVYNYSGTNPPVPVQSLNADPGEHFTGAGVLGNSGFMAYSAPLGENTSSKFKQWKWNGSGYTNVASGNLPATSAYVASGNVMQFQYEPFVTNNPVLLRVNNAGDWAGKPAIGAAVTANRETFLNSTQGLANPTSTSVGAPHPLAAFAMANQYSNMISLFSFNAPAGDKVSEVTISPAPGQYQTAIRISFTSANTNDTIYYRLSSSNAWITWAATNTNWIFRATTVQYYGQAAANPAKSAIKSASYTFTKPPGEMDSDGDGVPDYVELAKGLNPTGGADSDHDGYTDLEELIHNKNPNDVTSVPTNFPHLDDQAAFDLVATPLPWDGFSNRITLGTTGMTIRVHNFQGSLYSLNTTTNPPLPFARLTNIAIVAENCLLSFATEQHYNILTTNTDKTVGREMIGVLAVPPLTLPAFSNNFIGNNITNDMTNWVVIASNALNSLPRALVTNVLNVNKSLEALLVEQKIAELLGNRGSNWWTNITLFPFRTADLGKTNPPQATLLSLEYATATQPGYKLQTIFSSISNVIENSGAPNIAALRAVARDIYRINSVQNNTNPATFASPIDELRYFLWNGTLESNYLFWSTSAVLFASAKAGASNTLANVPPRPTTNITLIVRNDTVGGTCRILDTYGGGPTWTLLTSAGIAFSFPDNFQMLPGSLVQIGGYTDVSNSVCAYPAIEVTSALLASVPIVTDTDGDGNLLIDTWEKRFFGALGIANPFADTDLDGYSNIQEMIEQSDPRDFYGRPYVAPAAFTAPVLSLSGSGGLMELHFNWPAAYIGKFDFGVRHSPAIGSPFTSLSVSAPINVSGDEFKVVFAPPATPEHYYYLTVGLH